MISKNSIGLILGFCLVACICMAGCTQQPPVPPQTPAATTSSTFQVTAGMANPASVNCAKVGGTLEIKKDVSGGEYGMCTFVNGTSCEEWALFRSEGCKPGVTSSTSPPR